MNCRSNILSLMFLTLMPSASLAEVQKAQVTSATELQAFFGQTVDSLEIYLAPGDYHLSPTGIVDSTCGNCPQPDQLVPATAGLQIAGDYVRIYGPGDQSAVIHSHAGYGIFFDHCKSGLIENLSITDGARDADANATDAAIVVKNSTVTIRLCRIFDNIGDSSIVVQNIVGIMGICGRENSQITIADNEIVGNSWDGIALYRDARATITGNLIDGVDKAGSKRAGGGRGVGIGVTWNAQAFIEDNLIKRYWKGIGIFVDAKVIARNNIVEDMLTWGIAYWDAETGAPVGFIEDNIIYCMLGNVIVKTGQNPKYDSPDYYCDQCALSVSARPDGFEIADNLFFDNRRATEDLPDHDVTESEFKESVEGIRDRLLTTPLLRGSDFAGYFDEL